jgi:hypothetical protein
MDNKLPKSKSAKVKQRGMIDSRKATNSLGKGVRLIHNLSPTPTRCKQKCGRLAPRRKNGLFPHSGVGPKLEERPFVT